MDNKMQELASIIQKVDIPSELGTLRLGARQSECLAKEIYNATYGEVNTNNTFEEENEVLREALLHLSGMYGFNLSRNELDEDENKYEYSCNGYIIDKKTALVLAKARYLMSWWE